MPLFQKKDPKKEARKAKREVTRAQRQVERDRKALQRDENKLASDIKKAAAKGNEGEIRALAKQLVQMRAANGRMLQNKAQLGAVKTNITLMSTNQNMVSVLGSVAKTQAKANKAMDVSKLQKTMQEFQANNMKMEMTEEMMNDMMIDAFEGEDEEAEVDELTSQVLAELGVEMTKDMAAAPTNKVGQKEEEALPDLPDLKALAM